MKKSNILIAAFAALSLAFTAQAQVKIGSNPKVIDANLNLSVEATNASKVVVKKDNGYVGINTIIPSELLNVVYQPGEEFLVGGPWAVGTSKNGWAALGVIYDGALGKQQWNMGVGTEKFWSLNDIQQGGAARIVVLGTTGNVGIGMGVSGTTIADVTERLTVFGNAKVLGNITASGTITPSDVRFKENIVSLRGSMAKINQLRGVSYTHKAEFIQSRGLHEGNQIGFIAQELEAVFPEFVVTSSDGYKAVDYARLTPVLVESLKEVNAKLEAQQAEINELKAAVKQLMEKK